MASDLPPRAQAWARFLAELDWWVQRHGDAAVPQSAVSRAHGEDYPLGVRVKAHRSRFRRGGLGEDRARELESRPGWSWDGYSARSGEVWEKNLAAVRAYTLANGSLEGLESRNPAAARWLREQRTAHLSAPQLHALGRSKIALEERRGRLDDFLIALRGWIAARPGRDASQVRFSTTYRVGRAEYPLGKRASYWRGRHATGHLPKSDAERIEAVDGWRWEPPARHPGTTE